MSKHLAGSFRIWQNLANAALIILPFVWIGKKWRWTVLIPVWVVAIYLFTNILYYRFFGGFIAMSDYFMFQNWGGTTFNAGLAMMKPIDVALIFPAFAYTALYITLAWLNKTSASSFSKRSKWIVTLVTFIAFVGSEIHFISKFEKPCKEAVYEYYCGSEMYKFGPRIEYTYTGLTTFFIKGIARLFIDQFGDRTLSEAEIEQIEAYKNLHSRLGFAYQDTTINNRGKNLIYVVVESLNAWAVDTLINGHQLMPNLQKYIQSPSTVSALKVQSQIRHGISSDGQLIYNTGLYPATNFATVMKYADNDFASMPKSFVNNGGKRAFEVMCESPSLWNHQKTTKSYGYHFAIYNLERPAAEEKVGRDKIIFKKALQAMDTVPQPFMAFVTTISMHSPYKEDNIAMPQWIAEAEGLSEPMRNYLTVTNYFDEQLAYFINELKQKGLYDNSVIVIVSDHTSPVEGITDDGNIVFAALNTGITKHVDHTIGQVDVYPTILDIMGYDDEYRGMGLSVFNPNNTGAVDRHNNIIGENSPAVDSLLKMASPVANLILKGNRAL